MDDNVIEVVSDVSSTAHTWANISLWIAVALAIIVVILAYLGGKAFISIARKVVETAKEFDDKANLSAVEKLNKEIEDNRKEVDTHIKELEDELAELKKNKITDNSVDDS